MNGPSPTKDIHAALGRIGTAMTAALSAGSARSADQDALAGYAALNYEERMAVLEKLILDGVNDENFITLCEDVQGCWQRIGLGR